MDKKVKISYDYENDILYLFTGEKVKDSLQIDNFVIDFSHKDKIAGIEIFEASKILSKITGMRITKKMLAHELRQAYMRIYFGREVVWMTIALLFEKRETPIPATISLPSQVVRV